MIHQNDVSSLSKLVRSGIIKFANLKYFVEYNKKLETQAIYNLNQKIYKKFILLLIFSLLSVVVVELSMQKSFQTGVFKNDLVPSQNDKCTYTNYLDLYHKSELNFIEFCRDSNGFIESGEIPKDEPTIYICGGSTTETYMVPANKRWPAILEQKTNFGVVNDSASGRTFSECIDQLELYLQKFPNPEIILLANNVNALGKFAIDNASIKKLSPVSEFRSRIVKIYYAVFPGFSTARRSGLFSRIFKKDFVERARVRSVFYDGNNFKIDSIYSESLNSGCCHYASSLNGLNTDLTFDWLNNKNIDGYVNFYKRELVRLEAALRLNKLSKNDVVFAFEAYSYGLGKSKFGDPMRSQALYNFDTTGSVFSLEDSYSIVTRYDKAVMELMAENRWDYFNSRQFLNRPDFFYDAVHLTPVGSEAMSDGVLSYISNRLRA
jgi:hypothetical protein